MSYVVLDDSSDHQTWCNIANVGNCFISVVLISNSIYIISLNILKNINWKLVKLSYWKSRRQLYFTSYMWNGSRNLSLTCFDSYIKLKMNGAQINIYMDIYISKKSNKLLIHNNDKKQLDNMYVSRSLTIWRLKHWLNYDPDLVTRVLLSTWTE